VSTNKWDILLMASVCGICCSSMMILGDEKRFLGRIYSNVECEGQGIGDEIVISHGNYQYEDIPHFTDDGTGIGPKWSAEDNCAEGCGTTQGANSSGVNNQTQIPIHEEITHAPVCGLNSAPGDRQLSVCTIHCIDDSVTMKFVGEDAWVELRGMTRIRGQEDFIWRNGQPECNYEMDAEQPCEVIELRQDGTLVCGGSYRVAASARVPCVQVQRWPYPRGLVSYENEFEILGPFEAVGSISSREWCGDVRNYKLQVGWFMRKDVAPVWFFDEREWAEEPDQDIGMRVTHIYQTSSWGLPENGPSLEGELILPAYQVKVGTPWQPAVRRSWQTYVRGERLAFECEQVDEDCWRLYRQCEDPGTDREDKDCYAWEWETHDTGWQFIDLRTHGSRFPYYLSFQALDVTQPPADIPAVPLDQRTCGPIAVPVIEVQVILHGP